MGNLRLQSPSPSLLHERSTLSAAEMHLPMEEGRDLAETLRTTIRGDVRFDGYTRMLYSTDASLYQIQPIGVVLPRDADDVQATVEVAGQFGVPILPRGGGSSQSGQAVGAAVVLDFSKYMHTVRHVDAEARTVAAQPGLTLAALNAQLARHGLMVGPDPSSANRATVGGCVGNNASGSHSILYGMMADHVLAASTVLADGSRAYFDALDMATVEQRAKLDGLEGRIYAQAPMIVRQAMEDILERWPKHWRRASGYNLDRLAAPLLPADQRARLSLETVSLPDISNPMHMNKFNLAQLLAGSEGTLAVMTEVLLNLVPRPKRTALAVVHFDHMLDACTAVLDVLETEPSASELLDKQLMDLARAQPEWAKKLQVIEGDPAAVLLTEYYGDDERELRGKLDRLESHLRARGWHGRILHVLDAVGQENIWSVRKAALNLFMSRRGEFEAVPGIEDVSVPPERLAEYLEKILAFCTEQGDIPGVAVYAHASAGCLHVRPRLNTKTQRGVDLLEILGVYACDLAVEMNGAMSGEHGDGYARSPLNERLFGPALYGSLREMKHTFDPENRLNPGKIVDAPPITDNMRYGAGYETITLQTVFDWSADGGFAPAVEMCNGAGVCRKLSAGTMCPSFGATRDERDSTRGRANALRNAMAGRIPTEELYTAEMYGVLDLCLGCKACKSECPTAVDMAKIKAEYLVHYYRENGLPLFNRLMGRLPQMNKLLFGVAPALAPLMNWGANTEAGKFLMRKIGVHPARALPRYADETFERWFEQRRYRRALQAPAVETQRRSVVLFHDTWANYYELEIGRAAVVVLEAAGYAVKLPVGRQCCGRTLISSGQADRARAWVNENVALLARYAEQGIPIVGMEPSCILTLRDEYLSLADDPAQARLVADQSLTFDEFAAQEIEAGRFNIVWKPDPGSVLLHGHCHHKALVGNEQTVRALRGAGYTVKVIPSGCCGMAGDFGYAIDHYEVSARIGEDRLFPAVREAAPETLLVASGTSCRHQIAHFTNRRPVHLVQALAAAIEGLEEV